LRVPLGDLEVLVVDCQSTGANPEKGHLLEIAWTTGRAGDRSWAEGPQVESHLVRLPAGEQIPPRISALTGIRRSEMAGALPPTEIWDRLAAALPSATPSCASPAVAHFARFEDSFLRALHRTQEPESSFPLEWICTHQIVCRLLPGLPRRGLRAVSGYLGHVMREGKRAASHVHATVAVWAELVRRLSTESDVFSLSDLRVWMDSVVPVRNGGRDFPVTREARLGLPDAPGVYRMLGKGGEVLYVGKATSLKRRVNSHFQQRRHAPEKTRELLTQTWSIDLSVAGSPLEAALREADEIKQHAPPYNRALRERSRNVWFASRDLRSIRPAPDLHHPLGPLPQPDASAPLPALHYLLSAKEPPESDDPTWTRAMGFVDGTRVGARHLREGLEVFRSRRSRHLGPPVSIRGLLGLGARIWRERKIEEKEERTETEESAREEEGSIPRSPEQVVSLLEHGLVRGAHLLRRARWLRALCESSLLWRPGEAPRCLMFERGQLTGRSDGATAAPLPAGHRCPALERMACFDVATYDRLRVFTTELRRLVAAGTRLELCLGPRLRLDRTGLERRLFWV
jgi:DNA polymerase-3 subunit epsilon